MGYKHGWKQIPMNQEDNQAPQPTNLGAHTSKKSSYVPREVPKACYIAKKERSKVKSPWLRKTLAKERTHGN
jgi:hypothetical protein